MSKDLIELVEGYSDLLIKVLNLGDPRGLLETVLTDIQDTQNCIEKGLLR
jgi:hypothetical protein